MQSKPKKNGSFGKFRSIFMKKISSLPSLTFFSSNACIHKWSKKESFFKLLLRKKREDFYDENGNCSDDSAAQNENECNLFHHSTPTASPLVKK